MREYFWHETVPVTNCEAFPDNINNDPNDLSVLITDHYKNIEKGRPCLQCCISKFEKQ